MKNFDVKITGSGTKSEIVESLKAIIETIESSESEREIEAEDETLVAEIN
jgi:hypothetical protein